MAAQVLIIDDEEAVAWALRTACDRQGYRATVAGSAEAGLAAARKLPPDVVFLDIRLPGMDGLTALGKLQAIAPAAAVIVITAHGNLSTAVAAVAGGAFDYLAKPFDLSQALDAVTRAIASRGVRAEAAAEPLADADEIVGRSPAIQTVFKRIALVAPTDACVLITGESGTGKELVARAIHANSQRRGKPFLPVHVAALNPNLVESELFGHARGAFTGADKAHPGLFALANGGTVFLDELADIPLGVQAKLLRVLERQEVQPVGGTESVRVNVRVVSATHADLGSAVVAGTFRHDLFFRLNVYPIHVPSLGDRGADVGVLAEHFARRFAGSGPVPTIPAETLAFLSNRPWPGNVRELRNAIEHAAIVARGGPLRPEHFPPPSSLTGLTSPTDRLASAIRDWLRDAISRSEGEPSGLYDTAIARIEPVLLTEVLRQVDGNRLVAARQLGLARATVRKMMRKYGIDTGSDPDDGD